MKTHITRAPSVALGTRRHHRRVGRATRRSRARRGAASSNTLTITAGEYAYSLKGSPQTGWVTVQFKNGGVENHMMAVVKLKKGVTAAQLKKVAIAQDDAGFAKIADTSGGGDGSVSGMPSLLSPGNTTTTITQLKAGHYGIMCFVPAPADGQPHVAHGMVQTFDVSSTKSSAKPPTDGVSDVTISDSSITVPASTAPRNATVKVTNTGTAPHNFTIVKIESGHTLDEVFSYYNDFFNTGKATGTPPGTIFGGVDDIAPGGVAYVELTLQPGHYGYLSTDGDAAERRRLEGPEG